MDDYIHADIKPMSPSLEILSNPGFPYGEEEEYEYEYFSEEYREGDLDIDEISRTMNLFYISKACVLPTLTDISLVYLKILTLCFCFQLFNKFPFFSVTVRHLLSFTIGFAALYVNFQSLISHSVVVSVVSFVLINILANSQYFSLVISVGLLSYLTTCEFVFEGSEWARVRSLQMVLVMKIISLVYDYQNKRIGQIPSFIEYLGYLFCIGTSMYGPWIDFSTYVDIIKPKAWNMEYFIKILFYIMSSMICFVLSTCYLDWLLPDNWGWSFFSMYKDAIIFRNSHYFIILMSGSFILAAGHVPSEDKNTDWLTNPSKIELPRSLVEVVIYWNVPMHKWLKTYIFKPLCKYGRFTAIAGTYFVSSLLHGLNYQLSAILLSLGLYTFIEHMMRQKLARKFDACILTKSCSTDCRIHSHTSRLLFVKLINLMFTFIAVYHLSYLGCLIDLHNDQKLSFEQSFQRWHYYSYNSHILVLATAVVYSFL